MNHDHLEGEGSLVAPQILATVHEFSGVHWIASSTYSLEKKIHLHFVRFLCMFKVTSLVLTFKPHYSLQQCPSPLSSQCLCTPMRASIGSSLVLLSLHYALLGGPLSMSLRRKKQEKGPWQKSPCKDPGCLSHIFNILTQKKDFFLPQIKPNKPLCHQNAYYRVILPCYKNGH